VAYAAVLADSNSIAARRQVAIEWRKVLDVAGVRCSPLMQQRWAESVGRVTGTAEVRRLPSGAGHDAMVMAQITDMGMLFVRCGNGGISHHPAETMSAEDAELAAHAFGDFLVNLQLPP
jgi:acetylornithine deacetylase/succinyl-diaminopimelate desuccinylase-like protein